MFSSRRDSRVALPFVVALGLIVSLSALTARAAEEGKEAEKKGKGSVAGTVTDKDGKAIEGVEVRLMKPRQRGGGGGGGGGGGNNQSSIGQAAEQAIPLQQQQRPEPVAKATTDKDGKYTMSDVAAGEYMVGVRDEAKKAYGRARVTVEDGKTATADIKCTDTPPQRGGNRGGGGGGTGGNSGGGEAK